MGAVSNVTLTDITVGGIIGCSAAKFSRRLTETKTATNCWYLDTAAEQGDGYNKNASGITAKTAKQIADGDIGDGWVMGQLTSDPGRSRTRPIKRHSSN